MLAPCSVLRGRATAFRQRLPASGRERKPLFSQIENECKKTAANTRNSARGSVEPEMHKTKQLNVARE